MTLAFVVALLVAGALFFTLRVRPQDLPAPEPVNPFAALDETKARIYENLRDLQFEYRLGKLSDDDYQRTKLDLQRELAAVLAKVDERKAELGLTGGAKGTKGEKGEKEKAKSEKRASAAQEATKAIVCPHCGASFQDPMKFCGRCGKPMEVEA